MFKNQMNFRLNWKTGLAIFPIIAFLLFSNHLTAQSNDVSQVIDVEAFDKIIISPHIEVIFKAGEKESVNIESITVPMEKLNVKVKNNTLNVYLDGAKITAPKKKEYINGYKSKTSIYKGTIVRAIITYKEINSIDLRGEQRFVFKDNINTENLRLKIYGETHVFMNEVNIQNLQASIYGENYLEIKKGKIENQKFTVYGESEINALNIDNAETKLTAYGEADFQLNVSDNLKVTAYGEATINYYGNPNLQKGLVIGEAEITKSN